MSKELCAASVKCGEQCSSYPRRRECPAFYFERTDEISNNRGNGKFRAGHDRKIAGRPKSGDNPNFQPWRVKSGGNAGTVHKGLGTIKIFERGCEGSEPTTKSDAGN